MKAMRLAYKWDSGGQGGRYVMASKKYRGKDISALIAHKGQDLAGIGGRFAIAALHATADQDTAGINYRYALAAKGVKNLTIRAAHKHVTYLDYPYDILWTAETEPEVKRLAQEADVVHLNDQTMAYTYLKLDMMDKPALLAHHGTFFRNGHSALHRQAMIWGMVECVSTVDLLRHGGDELTWQPAPYDVELLQSIRDRNIRKPDGKIVIVQTPTNPVIKSTDKLKAAVVALQRDGYPVELRIGSQISNAKSLELKGSADIFFDQVKLGYGCSAIEAYGMGIPVIAGGDPWTEDRMKKEFGSEDLPFYHASDDEESIYSALKALIEDEDLRKVYGDRGKAHALKFHDELPSLLSLVSLYLKALDPATRPKKWEARGGIFRNTKYRGLSLNLEGRKFKFAGGRLEVPDPTIAETVRYYMVAHPEMGIEEEPNG